MLHVSLLLESQIPSLVLTSAMRMDKKLETQVQGQHTQGPHYTYIKERTFPGNLLTNILSLVVYELDKITPSLSLYNLTYVLVLALNNMYIILVFY